MIKPTAAARLPSSGTLGRRLLRGGSWAMLGKILTMPVALLLAVVLARILTPAEVGGYFLATSLVAVLMVLAQLGLGRAMIKYTAAALANGRPALARRAIALGTTAFMVATLVMAVLVITPTGEVLLGLLEDGDALIAYLPWLAVLVVGLAATDFAAEILRGFHDLRTASFVADQLLQRLLLVLVLLALWLVGTTVDLGLVLALAALAGIISAGLAAVQIARHLRALRHAASEADSSLSVWEVLRQGPPFLLMRLNFWLLSGAGIWVLGMHRPVEEVAVFGAATYLALLVQAPIVAVNNVLMPVAAELLSRGENRVLERVARGAAAVAGLPSLAATVLLMVAGGFVLAAVFGSDYAVGHLILAILAAGRCVGVVLGPCPILLTMSEHQRDVAVVMTAMSLATLAGFLILAPHFGGIGIATIVAIAITMQSLVFAWLVHRRLYIAVWPELSIAAVRHALAGRL